MAALDMKNGFSWNMSKYLYYKLQPYFDNTFMNTFAQHFNSLRPSDAYMRR